jgi:predicted ATPase
MQLAPRRWPSSTTSPALVSTKAMRSLLTGGVPLLFKSFIWSRHIDNRKMEPQHIPAPYADILLVQDLPPNSDYRFKHALIQDAAYENLLKSRRQALHRRIAETLRDHFATVDSAEPELLAHHFTQAGLTDTAIEWWGKAGQQSLEHSALVEAAAQLGRALDQIATLPPTPARRREEIKLQVALGGEHNCFQW